MVTNGMCRYIVSGGRVGATGAAGAGAGACRMRVGTAFGARRVGARRIGVAGAMFIGVWGVCCSTGGEGGQPPPWARATEGWEKASVPAPAAPKPALEPVLERAPDSRGDDVSPWAGVQRGRRPDIRRQRNQDHPGRDGGDRRQRATGHHQGHAPPHALVFVFFDGAVGQRTLSHVGIGADVEVGRSERTGVHLVQCPDPASRPARPSTTRTAAHSPMPVPGPGPAPCPAPQVRSRRVTSPPRVRA